MLTPIIKGTASEIHNMVQNNIKFTWSKTKTERQMDVEETNLEVDWKEIISYMHTSSLCM